MKLSKQSLLFRWAYLPELIFQWHERRWPSIGEEKTEIKAQTTLCEILGRALILVPCFLVSAPVMSAIVAAIGLVVSPFIYFAEDLPKSKLVKGIGARWNESLLGRAIKDFKNKTCTRITIE